MIIENFNIKAVRRALGLELKNVRRERALSQEQLSEAANISTKDINNGSRQRLSYFRISAAAEILRQKSPHRNRRLKTIQPPFYSSKGG